MVKYRHESKELRKHVAALSFNCPNTEPVGTQAHGHPLVSRCSNTNPRAPQALGCPLASSCPSVDPGGTKTDTS